LGLGVLSDFSVVSSTYGAKQDEFNIMLTKNKAICT